MSLIQWRAGCRRSPQKLQSSAWPQTHPRAPPDLPRWLLWGACGQQGCSRAASPAQQLPQLQSTCTQGSQVRRWASLVASSALLPTLFTEWRQLSMGGLMPSGSRLHGRAAAQPLSGWPFQAVAGSCTVHLCLPSLPVHSAARMARPCVPSLQSFPTEQQSCAEGCRLLCCQATQPLQPPSCQRSPQATSQGPWWAPATSRPVPTAAAAAAAAVAGPGPHGRTCTSCPGPTGSSRGTASCSGPAAAGRAARRTHAAASATGQPPTPCSGGKAHQVLALRHERAPSRVRGYPQAVPGGAGGVLQPGGCEMNCCGCTSHGTLPKEGGSCQECDAVM